MDPGCDGTGCSYRSREKIGFLKASKVYKVPRSTFENYVNYKSKDSESLVSTRLGRKCALGENLEKQLFEYCKTMNQRL